MRPHTTKSTNENDAESMGDGKAMKRLQALLLAGALLSALPGLGSATSEESDPNDHHATPELSAGDAAKGKTHFQAVCKTCHGEKGEGSRALNAPRLAGQADWYVIRQIDHFKAGIRGTNPGDAAGMQMRPMAMTLVDEQAVRDVAAYILTLPIEPAPVVLKGGDSEAGSLAWQQCGGCHGGEGMGNEVMHAPRLAGQYDWYLQTQLTNFRGGVRGEHLDDHTGLQMASIAQILKSDADVANIIAYINTLR